MQAIELSPQPYHSLGLLDVSETKVTGRGVESLVNRIELHLNGCDVRDSDIECLGKMSSLRHLFS